MNSIKIGGIILIVGIIVFFFISRGLEKAPELAAPNETSGPISNSATSSTPSPTPPTAIQGQTTSLKGEAGKEKTAGEPAKCEYKEFIIKIFSNTEADPTNLTVHVGDTVTFINEDNALHWPGADPHPTHSSLPTLDALGGISKNQSYSHTFKGPGIFGWHEHLIENNPPTVGHITVLQCQV